MNTIFKKIFKETIQDYQEIKEELKKEPFNSLLYFKALIYTATHLIQKPIDIVKGTKELFESNKAFKQFQNLNIENGIAYLNQATSKNNIQALVLPSKKLVFFEMHQEKYILYRMYEEDELLALTPNLIKALNESLKKPQPVNQVLNQLEQYNTDQLNPFIEELRIHVEQKHLNDLLNQERSDQYKNQKPKRQKI